MLARGSLSVLFAGLLGAAAPASQRASLPPTPKRPVADVYHGVKVVDDYRWLEDEKDSEVRKWSDAQDAAARSWLDSRPGVEALRKRTRELMSFPMVEYYEVVHRGGTFFALKDQPPRQQPLLVRMASLDDAASEAVVMDPVTVDPSGATAIDFWVPSTDGKLLAASLSKGGNESGTVWVWEVATGKKLADSIPRVNGGTAGGSLAWNADSTGFYYTRYPRAGERPEADLDFYQQVYFHKLGTPTEKDTYSVGKEFPRIAEIVLTASEDGRWVLARVANGDGGEFAFYVRPPGGAWTPIAAFADKLIDARFGRDQALYLLSRKGAPRGALLRLPLASLKLAKATVVVPESDGVIESYQPTATRLFVAALVGGPSELRAYGLDGKPQGIIATAPVSAVRQLVSSKGDELYFPVSSYLVPRTWYRLAPLATKAEPTALAPKSPVDFSQVEVLRETATSKDGTKVPMTILRKKGIRLDGSNPVMLEGYGGFNISLGPVFDPTFGLWFDHGGVYAVANLRGGGEYGEAWHLAGSGVHKQNVFDDFLACARRLIELKYTSPARLAIRGGSNGGLLMGAAMVQAPELFRAVVSIAGTYDMLRVELEANGAFNVTEFGTVKDPEQFKALYAYSPYHHVKDGVSYPALLMVNGANDTRVEPMSSRKFTARLQAASGLVLLRTPADFGHAGASLEEAIDLSVEIYTFLFDQLGMK